MLLLSETDTVTMVGGKGKAVASLGSLFFPLPKKLIIPFHKFRIHKFVAQATTNGITSLGEDSCAFVVSFGGSIGFLIFSI